MPRSNISVEALRKRIVSTFADVPKPLDSDIAPHRCLECDELRVAFAPYESLEVPDTLIKEHFDALPLFSPRALRYLLPAYLQYAMRNSESDVFEFVLYQLSPNLDLLTQDHYRERLEIFSKPERSAICAFLEWAESADEEKRFSDEIARARQIWSHGA
jgi:hypothetical protein